MGKKNEITITAHAFYDAEAKFLAADVVKYNGLGIGVVRLMAAVTSKMVVDISKRYNMIPEIVLEVYKRKYLDPMLHKIAEQEQFSVNLEGAIQQAQEIKAAVALMNEADGIQGSAGEDMTPQDPAADDARS